VTVTQLAGSCETPVGVTTASARKLPLPAGAVMFCVKEAEV
jgi:hypothetical protein